MRQGWSTAAQACRSGLWLLRASGSRQNEHALIVADDRLGLDPAFHTQSLPAGAARHQLVGIPGIQDKQGRVSTTSPHQRSGTDV